MQAVQGWHSCHPQKSRFFLFFCCSIQCMLALFSFCSPPYYSMAAVPPGFTSEFQAGRKRKKESRKGYRVNGAGQLNLSPFLVEKPRLSWKPYPEIFCLLLSGQNHVLCNCCLVVTGERGIFGQRLHQQPKAQYLIFTFGSSQYLARIHYVPGFLLAALQTKMDKIHLCTSRGLQSRWETFMHTRNNDNSIKLLL